MEAYLTKVSRKKNMTPIHIKQRNDAQSKIVQKRKKALEVGLKILDEKKEEVKKEVKKEPEPEPDSESESSDSESESSDSEYEELLIDVKPKKKTVPLKEVAKKPVDNNHLLKQEIADLRNLIINNNKKSKTKKKRKKTVIKKYYLPKEDRNIKPVQTPKNNADLLMTMKHKILNF